MTRSKSRRRTRRSSGARRALGSLCVMVVVGGALTVAATTASAAGATTAPSAGDRIASFRGLGSWLDVLDWSPTYTGGTNGFTYPGGVDAMAAHGVRTMYIQTSRFNRPEDVLDPVLLAQIIARAHTDDMRVVGWYLPTFTDPATDLRRLVAASNLPFDAIGVDIESTAQADIATRNANLVQLSQDLRVATSKPIAAIVLPPVVTDLLNPSYWPQFPWTTISALYDAWMPMCYWSNRTPASGWNDGYRYTAENIDRVRAHLGDPAAPVHPIGGIANQVTAGAVADMVRAATERHAIGGSLYDYLTTGDDLWSTLQSFNDLATVPDAPTGVAATAGNAQATVSWSAPASDGGSPIDSYRITPYVAGVAQTPVVTPTAALTYDVTGLVNGTAYTFAVEAHNAVGYGPISGRSSPATPTSPSRFHAQSPQRILDSRPSTQVGPFSSPWAPGETRVLPVAGHGGVPATGVAAVVMNVTVTDTSTAGYLTAYPDLTTRPTQGSNLNWAPGVTIPNLVTVPLGTNGAVSLYVNNSSANVIVDVVGYFDADTTGSLFNAQSPQRILDSRPSTQVGPFSSPWASGETRVLPVAGHGGVPATGATAVVMNVTVTDTSTAGYLTAYPDLTTRPTQGSNLNWAPGVTIPNLVTVPLGTNGAVSLYVNNSSANVIADVVGWYAATGAAFHAQSSQRVLDSRAATQVGPFSSPWAPGETRVVPVAGHGGVPATGATAVVMNVTVTDTSTAGYLTAYPDLTTRPTQGSNLNWAPGVTIPNLVTVPLGTNGAVKLYVNNSSANVIADVVGWYG